jgi:hypothetical protein
VGVRADSFFAFFSRDILYKGCVCDDDYDNRFAEHEHETTIRHACDLSFEALAKKEGRHPRFYPKTLFVFKINQSTRTDLPYLNYKSLRSLRDAFFFVTLWLCGLVRGIFLF